MSKAEASVVVVTLAHDHGQAQIALGPGGTGVAAAVLLIGFDRRHVTAVKRGENSGRTLAHVDVVRGLERDRPARRWRHRSADPLAMRPRRCRGASRRRPRSRRRCP
jgi:hypothetical protein